VLIGNRHSTAQRRPTIQDPQHQIECLTEFRDCCRVDHIGKSVARAQSGTNGDSTPPERLSPCVAKVGSERAIGSEACTLGSID
jgi:hypothetical protein